MMRLSAPARQALWILAVAALAIVLFVGGRPGSGPRTDEERVGDLAREFACPECSGQSVAESNAAAAINVRQEIARQVDDGRTDPEIRERIRDQFGERVLLSPPKTGFTSLVWVVPVAVAVCAFAGLGLVFWRWRTPLGGATDGPSDDDRDLVARFLAEREELTRS